MEIYAVRNRTTGELVRPGSGGNLKNPFFSQLKYARLSLETNAGWGDLKDLEIVRYELVEDEALPVLEDIGPQYTQAVLFDLENPEVNESLEGFLDDLGKKTFGRSRIECLDQHICIRCGGPAIEFKDDISSREFQLSAMCQKCQDLFWDEE